MINEQQLEHIAHTLLNSKGLTGGDDPKFLPKIFIVDGHPYWFLNAARRAAYGTNKVIHVMTIEQAWEIYMRLDRDTLKKDHVAWEFDQTGGTFNGCLFCDNFNSVANMTSNKVIPIDYVREPIRGRRRS